MARFKCSYDDVASADAEIACFILLGGEKVVAYAIKLS